MILEKQSYENFVHEQDIRCPYCGETQSIEVDCSVTGDNYYQDCQVCCKPIEIAYEASPDGELCFLNIRRDDE